MGSIPAVQWFARADRSLGSQPEAMEVAVEVSGARAAGSSGSRELFSENTTTTLVFEDGAVVRLSAPVLVGQLVFLRHQETQKEIVTRVLRQRNFGTATAYVELEFSEAAPGFWGANLSAAGAGEDRSKDDGGLDARPLNETYELAEPLETHQSTVPETAHSDLAAGVSLDPQTSPHVPAHPATPAPDAAEVARLREELAVLRLQMSSMAQPAAADAEGVADANTGGATSVATRMLSSKLPKPDHSAEFDGDEQPPAGSEASAAAGAQTSTPGGVRVRPGLIAALLILGLVAASAYFEGFLADWYSKRSVIAASAATSAPRGGPAKGSSRPASSPAIGSVPPVTTAVSAHSTTAYRNGPAGSAASDRSSTQPTDQQRSDDTQTASQQTPVADSSHENASSNDGNHLEAVLSNGNNHPVSVTAVAEESYEPPALVKSVNAVPPPDAIRGFVAGDVKFEALIDTAGKVSSATVISGPAALRSAAEEALRHYQYKPATKNGQAVAARVAVTVKFWYEP